MKHTFTILTLAGALAFTSVHSQTPPAAPGAGAAPASTPAQALTPLQQIQAIRDANTRLLEQQAKMIEQLDAMDKEAQQIKILAKRS